MQTNQPISWDKSTLYNWLNKQPILLGRINPKSVLSYIYPALGLKTTQISLFLTQCLLEYAEFVHVCAARKESRRQKAASYFFGLFYKKAKIMTNSSSFQSSTVRKIQGLLQRRMRAHS